MDHVQQSSVHGELVPMLKRNDYAEERIRSRLHE